MPILLSFVFNEFNTYQKDDKRIGFSCAIDHNDYNK